MLGNERQAVGLRVISCPKREVFAEPPQCLRGSLLGVQGREGAHPPLKRVVGEANRLYITRGRFEWKQTTGEYRWGILKILFGVYLLSYV